MRLTSVCPIGALAVALLAACSSSSTGSTGDGGTSGSSGTSGGAATGRAIVQAKLVAAASGTCSVAGKTIEVGSFTPPTPVATGAMEPGGIVNVACTVKSIGSGFDVDATVKVANGDTSAMTFKGRTTNGGADSGANFIIGFTVPGAAFGAATCAVDPTAVTGGLGGIAAGRYWTTFHCPDARTSVSGDLCAIDGEIRLEDCLQQ